MTQQKFGRAYRLTIWPLDGGDPIVIMLPFTVRIKCQRSLSGGQNILGIDIYNLSLAHRRRIYQDQSVPGQYSNAATPKGATPVYANILLEAGYGKLLHRIFLGHMQWADSIREGTNIVTHIEANSMLDDVLGSQVQTTLAHPISAKQILIYLVDQFPNLKLGAIGDFPMIFNRPVVLNGYAWGLIRNYSIGGSAFIDNEKVYILNNNEVTGGVYVIDDSTGILETPRRQLSLLYVTTLLETGVELIGQRVQIRSTVSPIYNGIYKVLNILHQGTISAAECGRMTSTFQLQASGLYGGPAGSVIPGTDFTIIPLSQAI